MQVSQQHASNKLGYILRVGNARRSASPKTAQASNQLGYILSLIGVRFS